MLEPYAARLAAARGTAEQWAEMADELKATKKAKGDNESLMAIDRRCHELIWEASGNRFLLDTLDTLYAQSDRLWHLYLADVADMGHAVTEHRTILDALKDGDGDHVAGLVEAHVRAFDEDIRAAVTERLESPLAG